MNGQVNTDACKCVYVNTKHKQRLAKEARERRAAEIERKRNGLESLNLFGNLIGDGGYAKLAPLLQQEGAVASFVDLDIRCNHITDAAFSHCKAAPGLAL